MILWSLQTTSQAENMRYIGTLDTICGVNKGILWNLEVLRVFKDVHGPFWKWENFVNPRKFEMVHIDFFQGKMRFNSSPQLNLGLKWNLLMLVF